MAFASILALLVRGVIAVQDQSIARFHAAVLNGHTEAVKSLLNARVHHDEQDPLKKTALHLAAIRGHAEVTQELLRHASVSPATLPNCPRYQPTPEGLAPPAFVSAKDGNQRTALHWAAQKGHEAVSSMLLEARVDLTTQDSTGRTALHWAALAGHSSLLDLLFKTASVDLVDRNGRTSLHTAAQAGHLALIKLLLKHRANAAAQDSSGRTPCHSAALGGHAVVVSELISANGSPCYLPDLRRVVPLVLASHAGHVPIAKMLLNAEGKSEQDLVSVLHAVAAAGHKAVVELLLSDRMAPDAKDAMGTTALHAVALAGHIEVATALLNAMGTNKSTRCWVEDDDGRTPFHLAAGEGHLEITEILIAQPTSNAHRGSFDKMGRTPAHLAAAHGHAVVLDKLLDVGSPTVADTMAILLHEASTAGHASVVELLLARNADRSAWDSSGLTAGDKAAKAGHQKILKALSSQPKAPGKASIDEKGRVAGTSRSSTLGRPAAEL
eukprot:gnl/MRDRNA2_/MRDRNA2_78865_c0_seq1.p1 gnl/MRDRNA2_/MRDRNA2_78865_c0~~gnl/MRDRNA2_/MRDRNA2_78865_c0_seq1.p1  ORF type:complete len:497 (+),score=93.57 gnl/MRDRNA2_/MRDRNA2_78865_c0_seq1:28-1518(+)